MKVYIKFFTVILLFFTNTLWQVNAQIVNSGFEVYSTCPTGPAQETQQTVPYATGWKNSTPATSDYLNTCGFTSGGTPASGSGFVGMYLESREISSWNYKEYVTNTLSADLVNGVTYTIKFKVYRRSNSVNTEFHSAEKGYFGLMFSTTEPSAANAQAGGIGSIVNSFGTGRTLVTDTNHPMYGAAAANNWVEVTLEYTAVGGEKYMTVGQFREGNSAMAANTSVYYMIDDFSITQSQATCSITSATLTLSENQNLCIGGSANPLEFTYVTNVIPLIGAFDITGTEMEQDYSDFFDIQWYTNTIDSNTGGTPIPGATQGTYTPPSGNVGDLYYYVVITGKYEDEYMNLSNCDPWTSNTVKIAITDCADCTDSGITSVNLNSLFVGTLPGNNVILEWWTSPTRDLDPANLGTKVTDPTNVTESGTYYAFFYDTVNECYNTDNSTASVVVTILPPCYCTEEPATGTPDGYTKVGITVQQKQNGWPENIPNGWITLESKEKGFVITRVSHVGGTDGTPASNDAIADPKEGMLVYDIQDECVKLYNGIIWNCINRGCNDAFSINTTNLNYSGGDFCHIPDVGYAHLPYTGGYGMTYGQIVSTSTGGVTGLTATLSPGTMAIGNGELVFEITGTPSGYGDAIFTFTLDGQHYTFTYPVLGCL